MARLEGQLSARADKVQRLRARLDRQRQKIQRQHTELETLRSSRAVRAADRFRSSAQALMRRRGSTD